MAVREFDGSDDVLTFDVGDLGTADGGTISIAAVWKPGTDSHTGGIVNGRNVGDALTWSMHTFTTNVWLDVGGDSNFASIPYTEAGGWVLHGIRNQPGANGVRNHVYNFGTTTWSHADVVTGRTAADTVPATSLRIGRLSAGGNTLDGRIAAVAVWDGTALDDTQFETLATGLAAWLALSPTACWALNQAAVGTAVTDLTGNGADQTARTGTAVITDDDPPGFNMELGSAYGRARVYAPGAPVRSGGG